MSTSFAEARPALVRAAGLTERRRRRETAWPAGPGRRIAFALLLALLAVLHAPRSARAQTPAAPAEGQVRGFVVSTGEGEPLMGARVETVGISPRRRATTGATGAFVLGGVPAGRVILRASWLGSAPLEVEAAVPANGVLTVRFQLDARPVELAPMRVQSRRGLVPAGAAPAGGIALLEHMTPLGVTDALPLAQMGFRSRPESSADLAPRKDSDVLYVRSASANLRGTTLDGLPVFAPFHMGGLLDAFDPELLASADVHRGGASARYDGGLSQITALSTRAGAAGRPHGSVSVDVLSARARAEGELARGLRFLAGSRWVHGAGAQLVRGEADTYGYRDGLLRLDGRVAGGVHLSATAYGNAERVELGPDLAGSPAAWNNASWSVQAGASRWGLRGRWMAGGSRFRMELPTAAAEDRSERGQGTRARAAADVEGRRGPVRLAAGGSLERTSAERDRGLDTVPRSRATGETLGAYAEAELSPRRGVHLRAGLRAEAHSPGERRPWLSPRLHAAWAPGAGWELAAGTGRYSQWARLDPAVPSSGRRPDSEAVPAIGRRAPRPRDGGPRESTAGGDPAPEPDAVERLHAVAGTHYTLSLRRGTGLGVEGYHRTYGFPGAVLSPDQIPPDTAGGMAPPRGSPRWSTGAEVWLRGGAGPVQGALGWSVAWTSFHTLHFGFPSQVLARQSLAAAVAARARRVGEVEARVSFGGGLSFTPIPLRTQGGAGEPGEPRPEPPPPFGIEPPTRFVRMDLGWSRGFAVGAGELRAYARLLNALSGADAPFYRFKDGEDDGDADGTGGRPAPINAVRAVPVFGLTWRF